MHKLHEAMNALLATATDEECYGEQIAVSKAALDALGKAVFEVPSPARVIICTEGGLVTTVKSSVPLDVAICDWDEHEVEDLESSQYFELLKAELETLPVEAY